MDTFRFKRFEVVQETSSMKVNTDGVLLGAAVTLYPGDLHLLDVGTGTGVIALMLAQRLSDLRVCHPERSEGSPSITGIDIDAPSASEAGFNFEHSPWADMLIVRHCALRDYLPEAPQDLIVSNPPYFESSLLPPEKRRGLARHAAGQALGFGDLAAFAAVRLRPGGRLAVILPADQETYSIRIAGSYGLVPFRIMRIRTTPRKPVSRVILEFSSHAELPIESELTIMDPVNFPENRCGYTPEYLSLTGGFYL